MGGNLEYDQISMLDNISFRYRTWVFKVNFSFEIQNLGISNLRMVALFSAISARRVAVCKADLNAAKENGSIGVVAS